MSVHPDAPVAAPDDLTEAERNQIAPYVTCTDGPVFALINLPESVKGALFARYSRSAKSLRRILLEEFLPDAPPQHDATNRADKADAFYGRVLAEYGDDSVAQLGAAHIAVEGASNVLTKVIEWGRLASYLEQSTRYIAYDDRPGGTYRYHRPSAVMERPSLRAPYVKTLDDAFDAYATLFPQMVDHVAARMPIGEVPEAAHRRAVRARALDSVRGLLPAATRSNVGIFASGQAYEAMLVRMLGHPLAEARATAALILEELRKVIPAFLTRVDRPDRGERHGAYLRELDATAAELATEILGSGRPETDGPIVRLVDFDPDGEARVLAHALWSASSRSLEEVRSEVARLPSADVGAALIRIAGTRADRRYRPGRSLEATGYAFEVVCDYGAYRDLQRHRLLSLQVQTLTPALGYHVPDDIHNAGLTDAFTAVQKSSGALHDVLASEHPESAPYAVTMAHRVRFTMVMNAREAMHLIELRSLPQGHESYRRVAQAMHRLIADQAGHHAIAEMMSFVDHSGSEGGRLEAEARASRRHDPQLQSGPR